MSDYNDGILPEPCLRMDTHFGDEYESVEFGDGTGYIKAAPILAKVGALHEEIDRLRDESAELRELVRKMARALGVCCGWCNASCGRAFECDRDEYCHIEVAMMELGMEAELEELKAEYEGSQSELHDGTEELGIEVD